MENRFSKHFYIKKEKVDKNGTVPIYLRIVVNGKRAECSINQRIKLEKWNKVSQRVKGSKTHEKKLNNYITHIENKIEGIYMGLEQREQAISAEKIKNLLNGKASRNRTLNDAFEHYLSDLQNNIKIKRIAPATLKRYESLYRHISNFLKVKYDLKDIALYDLNYSFVTDIDFYFRSERKCNHNSTVKYIRNLKRVLNFAIQNEWIEKNPFNKFKTNTIEVNKDFLTFEELKKLNNKIYTIDRLNLVKDIFVFACNTGLAYIDVSNLTNENIHKDEHGSQWIFIERQKSGILSKIRLSNVGIYLIEKYSKYPANILKGKVFPILSNQKMNAYLKEIADTCEINKNLTFHVARHTCATLMLTSGASIETTGKTLGHANYRQTQSYAKVEDIKIINETENFLKMMNSL